MNKAFKRSKLTKSDCDVGSKSFLPDDFFKSTNHIKRWAYFINTVGDELRELFALAEGHNHEEL